MAERIHVVPDELRKAARDHRRPPSSCARCRRGHADIMASLESLGPIFAELRDAGRELLDQRRACYEQQAAAHAELADQPAPRRGRLGAAGRRRRRASCAGVAEGGP